MDARSWNERYASRELLWSAEPNRRFAAEVESLPPGRALDLACGEGRNAIWLAERGWRVTAVDFSEVAVDRGRRIAAERGAEVDWVVADVLEHAPEPEAFDLVAVVFLQLDAERRRQTLAGAAAALAPGGTLVVIGHHTDNAEHGHGGPSDPALLFTEQEVVAELPGLEIENAERYLRPVDGATAIDALVRARRPGSSRD